MKLKFNTSIWVSLPVLLSTTASFAQVCRLPEPRAPLQRFGEKKQMRDGCRDGFHLGLRDSVERVTRDGQPYTTGRVSQSSWEDWGWTETPSIHGSTTWPGNDGNSPYCIMVEAFSCLERAAAEGAVVQPSRFAQIEAFEYALDHIPRILPVCDYDADETANSGLAGVFGEMLGRNEITLYNNFFGKRASERAGTLLHEAWHRGAIRMHDGGLSPTGGKRDKRYHHIYDFSTRLEQEGVSVYSIHADWFEDYVHLPLSEGEGRIAIDTKNRDAALAKGNEILRIRFEIPTSKRLDAFDPSMELPPVPWLGVAVSTYAGSVSDYRLGPSEDNRALLPGTPDTDFCALTSLKGSFRGENDRIWIDTVDAAWNEGAVVLPTYRLVAQGNSENPKEKVEGSARCFPAPAESWSAEFEISGDNKHLTALLQNSSGELLLGSEYACFLMGVEGRLEGDRDNFGVRVNQLHFWEAFISTNANDNNNFMKIKVGCVPAQVTDHLVLGGDIVDAVSHKIDFFPLLEEHPYYDLRYGQHDGEPGWYSHACVLSKVTGRMYGERDTVTIREHDFEDLEREQTCAAPAERQGDLCTDWHLVATGDGAVANHRNPEHEAVCFDYEKLLFLY